MHGGYSRGKKEGEKMPELKIDPTYATTIKRDFEVIQQRDAQIKQLFDELDAMQHRVDELTEKVDQLVSDMEDIARVFGAERR